jgi:hypothetical protein
MFLVSHLPEYLLVFKLSNQHGANPLYSYAFRLFIQGDFPDRDERTKKLAAYGITYSWLLTLVLIAVLYLANFFKLVEFTAGGVLGILLILMAISANIFRWYFTQKSDVE